ncbi:protein WHAT'S THIS FACTOR 1 homolog, chloroplastic [Ziziphus jujuba]|uniref:Protein WHAT'S THIS FACTOR 1 homolog, chloroplastic n=1 Tax=Ziziphus jujuba TaxID=326968 RepID=A0ABM3ILB9_ZIZJJ|nr:protein WHAT'S THIS FACTOR 1 homolog, chloroplastic [Ziziphus jujuba]
MSANMFVRRNWSREASPGWWWLIQNRLMTTSKRVQDRSKMKRVHDLEIVTEKWKIASKVLFLMEILKKEPEMIIPVRSLEQYRRQINLPKPHKVSDFIRKSPKLFELYKDHRGVLWCGMTKLAEDLVEEEERILEGNENNAAEYVTRFLMMSVDKMLPLDKIAHFRRDFGLPVDFRTSWVHKYPQHFKVAKNEDEAEYLKLVNWNPAWAITELEKKTMGITESVAHTPGLLSLPFPLKFPPYYKKVYRYGGKIEHFQKRCYLSPYADARGLKAGSLEFDKRAVAVMHELLSFTIEKRLVTDHLTHFRRELVMPQKLMRLLLKHIGIFYVSERGKRFSVFLTEAYEGSELIKKGPLVLWKEKVQSLIGYRGKKKKIETFTDMSDMEDNDLLESDSENESVSLQLEQEEDLGCLEDSLPIDNAEMETEEVSNAYTDVDTS